MNAEMVALIGSLVSVAGGFVAFIWKKLVKPAIKFLDDQDDIKKSIETIRSEVVTNGGSSLKDAVNNLTTTCNNIEVAQKILDQRSKAALHYHEQALFEVDSKGRIQWFNEKFCELTEDNGNVTEGFDYVSIVEEDRREEFLKELHSCIEMCRKIDIETASVYDQKIHFTGYPYRVGDNSHEGFLIHLYKEN